MYTVYPVTHWFISFSKHQPHDIKLKWVIKGNNQTKEI